MEEIIDLGKIRKYIGKKCMGRKKTGENEQNEKKMGKQEKQIWKSEKNASLEKMNWGKIGRKWDDV